MNADLTLRQYFIAARRHAMGDSIVPTDADCSGSSNSCSCRIVAAEHSAHPTADQWVRIAEGMMGRSERSELHRHARSCGECRTLLVAFGQRTSGAPNKLPRRAAMLIPVAAAAAFVLMFWNAPNGGASPLAGLRPPARLFGANISLVALGYPLNESSRNLTFVKTDESKLQRFLEEVQRAMSEREPHAELIALATRAALTCRNWPVVHASAKRWTDVAPEEAAAWNVRGMADFVAGDYALAQQNFERALILSPRECNYLLNVAQAADRAGDLDQARKCLLRYLELADTDNLDTAKDRELILRWLEELSS